MAITAEGMLRINGKTPGLPGPRRHPKGHLWSRAAAGGLENTTGGGIKLCHFDQMGCTKLRFIAVLYVLLARDACFVNQSPRDF